MNSPLQETFDRDGAQPGSPAIAVPAQPQPTSATQVSVTKRDGTHEPFDADRINRAVERATEGLDNAVGLTVQIASELAITLFDGITTEQLDEAAIQVAVQNVKDDPAFDTGRGPDAAQDDLQAGARQLRDGA